jgi:DNA-directed RNA polymerase subunit beta
MALIFKKQYRPRLERKYFTSKPAIPVPDLIELQKESYAWFLKTGIRELFEEVSPMTDFSGRDLELYLENYYLDEPRFDEVTCRERNITFEAPLRVTARMVNKRDKSSKSQEIYLGDLPLMTDRGTFVVNGIERVVVTQFIRSAGAFFMAENIRGHRLVKKILI